MRIVYAGDSPAGGPANYLLAVLKRLRARVTHVPPGRLLTPRHLQPAPEVVILSDMSRRHVPAATERLIAAHVAQGTGLLMVGGWGSFAGPFGQWRGSIIEQLLPVRCLARDDRVNFPGSALITLEQPHRMFQGLSFLQPPAICGLNEVRPTTHSRVLLSARRILAQGGGVRLEQRRHPLLIIDDRPGRRIAALATDLAPHWCGGLVDWGSRHLVLPVNSRIQVEVGDKYVQFVSALVRWGAGR
jgi:uncharacterized membrane protein